MPTTTQFLIANFKFRSTTGVSFVPEPPPEDLHVEFQYTRGGMTTKYNIWTAILRSMAKAALLRWNAEIAGTILFPEISDVEIRFISSINPPRLKTKMVIWTLGEAFDFYNEQRIYSNCFVKVQFGTGPTAHNLGVASIKSTLSTTQAMRLNSSVSHSSNDLSFEPTSSTPVLEAPRSTVSNHSFVSDTEFSLPYNDSQLSTGLQAGSRGLSFSINYVQNGATINDKAFFRILVRLLVFAAQHEPKDVPCGLIRAYNTIENYTFAIGPTSDASRDNLPWKLMIPALGYFPSELLEHGQGGRWAELSGRIKLDGAYIGKVLIV